MKEGLIYIVIPVFNRKHFTKDCLLSLRKQTYQNYKAVVVDDGSTDGTPEMLRDEFPETLVITGDGNLWWTAATNLGIYKAQEDGAEFVLTLNNDTVATEDYLEKMIYWARKKPNALLGSFALDFNSKKAVYGGANLNWLTNKTREVLPGLHSEEQTGLHRVNHFPGRGLLIPISVIEKIGPFDEKVFPHYYADYDYTFMAHRKGYEVYCNHDAKLYIFPEASGDHQTRTKKSLKKYYNHLFGIKGGGNLRNYTKFVFRNCPGVYMPFALLDGYTRRIFGYLIK